MCIKNYHIKRICRNVFLPKDTIMKKINYKKLSEETESAHTSDSPVKSAEYNRAYREWRSEERNPFVFAGKRSRNLHTYVDGVGTHKEMSENQERSALKSVCRIITAAVFIYAIAENVLIIPVILLLKGLGMDIGYSFHESSACGDQYAVLIAFVFEGLMKFVFPLLFMRKILKMPFKVAYPFKIGNSWAVFAAITAALIGFALTTLIRIYLPLNIFTVNDINMTYKISFSMNTGCKTAFLIFELLLVPIMKELLYHGALFQALRQFGVSFAVIMMAVIVTAEMHNPFSALIIFTTIVIAGYGIWQSGSIITGIIVHIVVRSLSFMTFWWKDFPDISGIPAELIATLLIFIIGLISCFILSFSKNKMLVMKDYETFISVKGKIRYSALETSLLMVWVLCGILMLIEVFV